MQPQFLCFSSKFKDNLPHPVDTTQLPPFDSTIQTHLFPFQNSNPASTFLFQDSNQAYHTKFQYSNPAFTILFHISNKAYPVQQFKPNHHHSRSAYKPRLPVPTFKLTSTLLFEDSNPAFHTQFQLSNQVSNFLFYHSNPGCTI